MVVPDFEATMNSVRATSICASSACTASGTVESSTSSSRISARAFRTRAASTSEQRLEPPMPRTTTCVEIALDAIVGERHQLRRCLRHLLGDVSQPRALAMIFLCASSFFQSVASFVQMRVDELLFLDALRWPRRPSPVQRRGAA